MLSVESLLSISFGFGCPAESHFNILQENQPRLNLG